MRRLAVFLASSNGLDPAHAAVAASVGTELARRGIGLVYGGGRRGLMGVVADSALKAGGEVIGVMPRGMVEREWAHEGVTELVICDSMHERKAIMAERADAFVALPGGLGTLEEIFEVWSWRQLGFHGKPVGFLDAGGFWTPLLGALRGITDSGFLPASTLDDLAVAPDLPGLLEALEGRLAGVPRPAHGEDLR
ncbi:TIGR00730 family Rossman fold protein [Streptomyces sp. NPDC090306]|uniref:LOG family protein n=1 Tax=Streptomyces sp. NPDC090306 TaxID=3365961 RepID=UPI003804FEF9